MLLVAFSKRRIGVLLCVLVLGSVRALSSEAQTRLSLEQAVSKVLESRASLKAEAKRIAVARGLKRQAGAIANPEFQFENQNLRPGQTYSQDVDTLAVFTQPLDILGKRKQRIAAAESSVNRSQAEYLVPLGHAPAKVCNDKKCSQERS